MTSIRLTAEELLAIRSRCNSATPGPWRPLPPESKKWVTADTTDDQWLLNRDSDAEFVAHARMDLPRCLDEIESLRARVDDLERVIQPFDHGTLQSDLWNRRYILGLVEHAVKVMKGEL
jgi:hypothetical protein